VRQILLSGLVLAALTLTAAVAVSMPASTAPSDRGERVAQLEVAEGFELVGHDPLFARGMNSAPAVYKN
jgi:hypothetical protein